MIKGFINILVGSVLGGEAMRQVGGISEMPKGLRDVTQIGIGLGIMGHSSSQFFKFKRK